MIKRLRLVSRLVMRLSFSRWMQPNVILAASSTLISCSAGFMGSRIGVGSGVVWVVVDVVETLFLPQDSN